MVHDLTANQDFMTPLRILQHVQLLDRTDEPSPEEEIIFTGDASERRLKRFEVDYKTDKNICDCCGGFIDRIPWHWKDNNKTLCSICDSGLIQNMLNDAMESADRVIGTLPSGEFQIAKPWTMIDNERENVIDNVLLWD